MKHIKNNKVKKTFVLTSCLSLIAFSFLAITASNNLDKDIETETDQTHETKAINKLIINDSSIKSTAFDILNNNKNSKVEQCIQKLENTYIFVEEQQKEESKENSNNGSSNKVEKDDHVQNVEPDNSDESETPEQPDESDTNNQPEQDVNQEPTVQKVSLGTFKLTAYCPCSKCCGKWSNGTGVAYGSTGTKLTAGYSIAVDPSVIPYYSTVIINGHEYVAHDTGGAIRGNRIDVFFNSHQEALNFGVQYAEVFIYK